MIFEALMESVRQGELILLEYGYCRWHLRQDHVATIYEIISLQRGTGSRLLTRLIDESRTRGATWLRAACPADLPANGWWQRRGFTLYDRTMTRSQRELNLWMYQL